MNYIPLSRITSINPVVFFSKFWQMFGKIRKDDTTEIHRNNNFGSFAQALLVLFR